MKHAFKLQKDRHPRWHLFVCTKCGEAVRISKWELHRLLKGWRRYSYDFLPPCSVVPPVKLSRADRERRMKGYVIGD